MSRFTVGYPKDRPCIARMAVSYAPYEHFTPAQLRELAADALKIADEIDTENLCDPTALEFMRNSGRDV